MLVNANEFAADLQLLLKSLEVASPALQLLNCDSGLQHLLVQQMYLHSTTHWDDHDLKGCPDKQECMQGGQMLYTGRSQQA